MNYSEIANAIMTELTGALPVFSGLIAVVIGVPLVLRVVKRIAR